MYADQTKVLPMFVGPRIPAHGTNGARVEDAVDPRGVRGLLIFTEEKRARRARDLPSLDYARYRESVSTWQDGHGSGGYMPAAKSQQQWLNRGGEVDGSHGMQESTGDSVTRKRRTSSATTALTAGNLDDGSSGEDAVYKRGKSSLSDGLEIGSGSESGNVSGDEGSRKRKHDESRASAGSAAAAVAVSSDT